MSNPHPSQQPSVSMARLAGLSYIIYSIAGAYITFGPIPGLNAVAAAGADSAELEFLVRTRLLVETLLYTFVGVSAASMYVLLRTVSPGMAAVGAFCRLIESAMGATFIILSYAAFASITNPELLVAFSDEERASIMGLFRHVGASAIYFLLIPMAFGGAVFFGLFFRSRLIPRWLSAWGIVTYIVIGTVASIAILYPELRQHIMLFFLPGSLFEWVVALWLLFAGINTRHWTPSSAGL